MTIPQHLRITTVKLQPVIPNLTAEADRRYRMLVLLQRSDRRRYYTFHCPICTAPVGEIVNADVVAITDLIDMSNIDTIGAGLRCNGRYHGDQSGKCSTYYYFSLNEK